MSIIHSSTKSSITVRRIQSWANQYIIAQSSYNRSGREGWSQRIWEKRLERNEWQHGGSWKACESSETMKDATLIFSPCRISLSFSPLSLFRYLYFLHDNCSRQLMRQITIATSWLITGSCVLMRDVCHHWLCRTKDSHASIPSGWSWQPYNPVLPTTYYAVVMISNRSHDHISC